MAGTPGADDNASGVAALLEAARITALLKPAHAVVFAAFNLEEYGMTGSASYARELADAFKKSAAAKKKFQGMLSLEMVGYTSKDKGSQVMPLVLRPFYPDTGNFLALVGDSSSSALLEKGKSAFASPKLPVETLKVPLKGAFFPAVRLSDHSPFWDEDLPALLVTDTSFFRNPHYHLPSDRIETLDVNFLEGVTEGVVRLIASAGDR